MWIEQLGKVFRGTRDIILFGGGLVFAADEILISDQADPQVLILVAGMLGLGAIFRA